jgi:nucleoside-diphosphate-sugar epimerase
MKVLVTGGAGKLGRWVTRRLLRAHHDVIALDRLAGDPILGIRHVIGDAEDLGQVYGAMAGCDAVIHLAGVSTHGVTADELTFRSNVISAFNVHEAAWRLGVSRVVTMSSEAVLGWAPGSYKKLKLPDYLPIDEDHECRAQDPYGLSKICCEAIGKSYASRSDMVCVVLRPPWIAAPEEIQSLRDAGGREPNGFRLYHYIDVRDLSEVCLLATERSLAGFNVFFVGSGETTIRESIKTLYTRLDPCLSEMTGALDTHQAPVSIERARAALDWAPRYSWRNGSS